MIIVKIIGGLGNQMFQYAYAKVLQQKGYTVKIDISAFETYKLHGGYQLDKYNIDLKISTKEENDKFYKNHFIAKTLRRLGFDNSNIIQEKSLAFDEKLLNIKNYNYISGYFQNEMYFKEIKEILLKEFTLNLDKSKYTNKIENEILDSKDSCAIHIRRGDYSNSTNINIHGVCDLAYYDKAISFINSKYDDLKYFIFSDDILWVKENLKMRNAIYYIDSEEKRTPHEDMYLMSLCKNNIIANSSFSWWGAWLNKNDEKIVIAPKRWFSDDTLEKQSKNIVCDSWLKI
ncbi:MAG TPA: alpha-1,2-fucosyltransferase [Arcobacter sp.]|nr:alpha-1,2-fucosyltransferase [Arcobacter sp.]